MNFIRVVKQTDYTKALARILFLSMVAIFRAYAQSSKIAQSSKDSKRNQLAIQIAIGFLSNHLETRLH